MKRISFLLVALLLMGGMAMAQGSRRGGDKQVDPKVRAERMTERMAKEYSLNDSQKQQLLEANQAMLAKMGRPDGTRHEMRKGKKDKSCQATDSCTCTCKKAGKKDGQRAPKMTKEEREKMHQEMKASREAYDVQLKKILTKEQYDTYTKKQAERQKKMAEGRQQRKG